MKITAYDLAQRFVGVREAAGAASNATILAMLQLDDHSVVNDETPWCSAFANFICWLLRLPRSKSLAARSWLNVGRPVSLHDARTGFDVVVLSRGNNAALGHVGFYAGTYDGDVMVLGGNQGDSVSIARYPADRVVSVQRLWEDV